MYFSETSRIPTQPRRERSQVLMNTELVTATLVPQASSSDQNNRGLTVRMTEDPVSSRQVRPYSVLKTTTNQSVTVTSSIQEYEEGIDSWIEDVSRSGQAASSFPHSRHLHPAFALAVFKEKLANRDIDVRTLFPSQCFQHEGRIANHHLRNALLCAGIPLSEDGFSKLWKKFDRHNVGLVPTRQFLKDADLDMLGRPLRKIDVCDAGVPFDPRRTLHQSQAKHTSDFGPIVKKYDHSLLPNKGSSRIPAAIEVERYSFNDRTKVKTPKFGNLTQAVLAGFKLFDPDDTGIISARNLAHVLQEFNIVQPPVIQQMLSNSTGQSQWVHYRDYPSIFKQSLPLQKGNERLLQRIRSQRAPGDIPVKVPLEKPVVLALSLPNLYKTLKMQKTSAITQTMIKLKKQVQQQHNYLKTYFQVRDRMGLGHIAAAEMKSVMDRMYWGLTDKEKEEICGSFDLNLDGRFHYEAFLGAISAAEHF